MGNYKRKVTYFYQYSNGMVGATAGFLKMEIRGDNVKITINIQEPYRAGQGKPVLCFYHEAGEYLAAVKICEVEKQGGVLTLQTRTPWHDMFDTGRDLYTFDGVLVLYSENDYYIGDFDDRDRSSYEIRISSESKDEIKKSEKTKWTSEEKMIINDAGRPDREKRYGEQTEIERPGEDTWTDESTEAGRANKEKRSADGVEAGGTDKEKRSADGVEAGRTYEEERSAERTEAGRTYKEKRSAEETDKEKISYERTDIVKSEYENIKDDKKRELFEKAGLISETGAEENNKAMPEKCKECPYSSENRKYGYDKERIKSDNKTDSFDCMLQEYPKLPMYNVDELFDCVRINPNDIGRLDISNWKLGSNSFLTHGYYTYQYLMLGKMRFGDGKRHAVLGVPGVYTNREKYIANMFGFNTFIPIKKTGVRSGANTGQFGYWIVELNQ